MKQLVFLILFLLMIMSSPSGHSAYDPSTQELTNHGQIEILSDADFETQGWEGNGTDSDPYRIENLRIISNDGGPCIKIRDVSVVFVISNCILSGTRTQQVGAIDIWIHDGHEMQTIVNVQISNSSTGILVQDKNMTVKDCTFLLDDTEYVDTGIYVKLSEDIDIINCTFIGDGRESAIHTPNSNGIKITRCVFENVESFVEDAYSHWLGDLPPEFLISENTFRKDSSIKITANSSIVSNLFIDFERSGTGPFALLVSESVCDVYDNVFENCTGGVRIHSNGSRVHNNTFSQCTDVGANIWGNDNTITNNTFNSCYMGIYVGAFSTNNQIYYNTFVNNEISAEDVGIPNVWDDSTSMGNYWDDFPSSHEGEYEVSGTANSVDRWPVYIGEITHTQDDAPIAIVLILSVTIVAVLIVIVAAKKRVF